MRISSFKLGGLLVGSLLSSLAMAADPMVQLAAEKGCFICHSVAPIERFKRPLAPSYQEIADRYRDQEGAFELLVNRVLHGSAYTKQNWAGMTSMRFMPPNVNVNREEATALVNWILKGDSASEASAKHTAMLALATNSGCMTCHLVDPNRDSRLVPLAPAFRAIAGRYAGQADARGQLVDAVKEGTVFKEKTWHNANMRFMPPNPQLRKEDAEVLVDWIMALSPGGAN